MKLIIKKIREYIARLLNIHVLYNVIKRELYFQKKANKKLKTEIEKLRYRITGLESKRTNTTIEQRLQRIEDSMLSGLDIYARGPSWGVVCLAGRNDRAYVEFFELPEFEYAQQFRDILRRFRRATIDAPPGIAPLMRDMIQESNRRRAGR